MNKLALLSCALVFTACSVSEPAPGGNEKPAAQAPAAAPSSPDASAALAAAELEEEAADKNGCIYAEGEKDEPEAGCPHGDEADGALAAKTEGHFGSPFALDEPVPLSTAVTTASDADVLVSGEVEAVCQKKGCWMVVKDGDISARVLMKDHGFAVPMDSRGKKVQVEGTLTSRTFTEAQVKHLEKDGGGDPSKVSGTRTEHVLTASGISIQS